MIRQIEEVLNRSIPIARITSPHGLTGEVKAKMLANYSEVFIKGKEYFFFHPIKKSNLKCTLEDFKFIGERMIIRLKNIDHIEWAKKMEGFEMHLDLEDLPKLKEGEYYFFQVFNSEVYDDLGNFLGIVDDIIETGSADVLSIRKQDHSELLIPVVRDFILTMNLSEKRITVRPPVYWNNEDDG